MNQKAKNFLLALNDSYEMKDYCLECDVPREVGEAPYVGRGRRFKAVANLLFHLAYNGIEPKDFAVALARFRNLEVGQVLDGSNRFWPSGPIIRYGNSTIIVGTTEWLAVCLYRTCFDSRSLRKVLELL